MNKVTCVHVYGSTVSGSLKQGADVMLRLGSNSSYVGLKDFYFTTRQIEALLEDLNAVLAKNKIVNQPELKLRRKKLED